MLANLTGCIEMVKEEMLQSADGGGAKKGRQKRVIPWRSSKLTMLLRDKIGGANLTLLIGAISPAKGDLDGSRRTLEFLRIGGELRRPCMHAQELRRPCMHARAGDPINSTAPSLVRLPTPAIIGCHPRRRITAAAVRRA